MLPTQLRNSGKNRADEPGVEMVADSPASPAALVFSPSLSCGYLEGGEQGGGAIALIIMAVANQGPSIGEFEIPLCPLQSLDRLVHANDDRVLGRPI